MSRVALPTIKPRTLERIEAIYARLPKLECKRLCQDCCGPVFMSRVEEIRIVKRVGEKRYRNTDLATLNCPMLNRDGSCSVYHIRPLICRLWGLVKDMACPHGCQPERWLTDEEGHKFLAEMAKVGR